MTSVLRHKAPKGDHYNAQLSQALLKGNWADGTAGSAPNGAALSWPELIRKWGKHTGGNTSLVHHLRDISLLYLSTRTMVNSTYINVSAEHSPAGRRDTSAPGSSSSGEGTATSASNSSFVHVPHPHRARQASGPAPAAATAPASSSKSPVRQTDGRASFLNAGDLDADDVDDDGPWAEDGTWWTAVASENVDEVKEGIADVEKLIKDGKLNAGEQASAKAILAYHHFSIGDHASTIRVAEALEQAQDIKAGLVHGNVGVLDRIRTMCLRAMSLELTDAGASAALPVYLSIPPLLDSLDGFNRSTPNYLSQNASAASRPSFEQYREVHRLLSSALSRAAVLSSRGTDLTQSLRVLRTYHSLSGSWPSSFRPVQRQRMLLLYLRALQAGYPAPRTACTMPYLIDTGSSDAPARQVWKREVIEAIKQGQQLLSSTTSFPRAGTINLPVRRFTEACVALADIHTPFAKEVIAVLYWAMTLTFQSQSLLRHLTRLLATSGSYLDAKRTFELYVQIVLKDRETKQPEISLQLKRRPTESSPAHPAEIAKQAEEAEDESGPEAEERKSQFAEAESDSNADFVRTLIVGSRLLLKDLNEVEEAWRFANLAGKVVSMSDQSGKGVPLAVRAQVAECKGIVRMAMAMSSDMPDVDATNRASYQSQALDHLKTATSLSPKSASAHYHLAYCLGEARQIEAGVEAVQKALELDGQNVQLWHLLALLLTASKDWEGAAKACEAGVGVWEQDEEDNADELDESPSTGNPNEGEPSVDAKDFASARPATLPAETTTYSPIIQPSGAIRPRAPYTPPPPTRSKKLENVIRLRITYKVIVEKTQGAEVAMEEAEDLFAFFSARCGNNRSAYGYRRGLNQGLGESMASVRDLGGSYISVADLQGSLRAATGPRSSMISIQAPTPDNELVDEPGQINPSINTSPDESSANSVSGETHSEKERTESGGRKSTLHRKMLETHLHVPSSRQVSGSRPGSIRRLAAGASTSTPDLSLQRDRTFSVGSAAALSLAPTQPTMQSRAPSRPPSPPHVPGSDHGRTPTESRILSGLWLQSAATYRRWGKVEQCLVSIQEAEITDPENPDVWVQLGLLHRTTSPHSPNLAISAFTKAVLLRPDYPPAVVSLSKVYLATQQVELAHNMLYQLTQEGGWDVPEAWYYLGKACQEQGRKQKAKECFLYALELEKTRPCRTRSEAVDRWL